MVGNSKSYPARFEHTSPMAQPWPLNRMLANVWTVEAATGCGAGVVGVATATPGLGWFNIVVMTASETPCCRR